MYFDECANILEGVFKTLQLSYRNACYLICLLSHTKLVDRDKNQLKNIHPFLSGSAEYP